MIGQITTSSSSFQANIATTGQSMLFFKLKNSSRFGERHAERDLLTLGTRINHRFFDGVLSILSHSNLMGSVGLPFVPFLWGREIP